MVKMIYSDYLETMIPQGFTTRKVIITNDGTEPLILGKKEHFFWDEEDLVYYSDCTVGKYYMEIPHNAIKISVWTPYCHGRLLVKLDKE